MNKLVKNYIYNLAYQIFVIIVPLITMPYLARVLHAENMGIYSYVTSCASIINTIGLLGLYNYGDREIAYTRDNRAELNRTFSELMSIRLILCIVSTIAYLIWAVSSEYTSYFLIYYLWLLTGFIDISWFFAGIEDMGPMVFKNFMIKVLNIICIFVFVRTEGDLSKYFALVAVTTFLANLSMYLQLRGQQLKFRFTLKNSKTHLTSAVLLFLPQLASLFYLQVDKIMLKYLSDSASQVAFYDQAEKIVNIPFSVVTALSVVMMPRIANEYKKGNTKSVSDYILKSARFALMISIPIFLGLDAIADNFIPWYLGDEYLPVIQAIWIISPIIITNTLVNIAGTQYLTAVDRTKILTVSNVVAAIMNLVLNSILIPRFGFYGAAIATIISSLCCAAVQLISMNKDIRVLPLFVKTWKYWVAALSMFVIIKVAGIQEPTVLNTVLMIFIGIIVYTVAVFILNDELARDMVKIVKKVIRRNR